MADTSALKSLAIKLQNASDSRSKIHCLEQISKRCNVLKQTLTSRGLEDHSSSMEDETGRDRINDLPDELLVDIFKLHIRSEHVRRNAALTLVCRRWRNLVDSVPSLWNWVQAIPHSSLRNLDTCKKMVEHCLERSGKMPLDLTLDFRLLWDAKNYPDRLVEPYLSSEPDCDDLWKVSDKIREESILSYIDYTSSLQSAFAGWPYACYADRWRSFRIFFSDWMNDMDVSRLLGSFAYPDPSLDTLETLEIVHGLPGSDSFSGVEQAIYENKSFRSMRKLKSLSTSAALDLSQFPRCQRTLRSLSIPITPISFNHLPHYSNLRTLHLTLESHPRWDTAPEHPTTVITLPRLTTLRLSGDHSPVLVPLIDAPRIRHLRLSSFEPVLYPQSQLFRHIRSLDWDIRYYINEEDMIRQSLSAVLSQCERLIALTMWADCMPPASDPMKEMVDNVLEAHSLCRLKTITYLAPGEKEFDDSAIQEVVTF